jgi:cytoskeletal protein CcmA (bactofilin family)
MKEKKMTNPTTVVGAHTLIRGNLEGDEDLTVVGRVDGNINLTKTLNVEPSGVVVADVRVKQMIISGAVMGNITATDLIHIAEGGRVVGDLVAPRVVLVDGASFKGNIDMGDLDAPREASVAMTRRERVEPSSRSAAKPAPRPAPPPKKVVTPSAPRRKQAKSAGTLDERAKAAAKAVASAAKNKKAAKAKAKPKRKPPKPPTTAGKKTRARRR